MDCKLRTQNCGGCPMLSTEYAEQLKKKESAVRVLLGKYGPVAPIRGMETPYHYRNKVISTFAPAPGGKLTSGIYAARTHKVLPVESCLLQDEVLDKVRAGNSLSESLALVDGFEQSMSSSIAVGEETGKLDELLATISETLDFEAEVATKRLVTLLEPIMIVIMGLIVAFVVVAVILPIYQSYGTIGQSSSTY